MTIKHRQTKSRTYVSWRKMRERCTNPKAVQWKWYGGRGIRVCDRWMNSFEAFIEDVGERPSLAHTIDRFPNVDGNYEPGNCRWATKAEQINNQKKTIQVEVDGETITLRELCRRKGIKFSKVYGRMQYGYDLQSALAIGDLRFKDARNAERSA